MDLDIFFLICILLCYLLICTIISTYFVVYFSHKSEKNFTGLFAL